MTRNSGNFKLFMWVVAALVFVLAACAQQPTADVATLTVDVVGDGRVVSDPAGIDIASAGSANADFAVGTEVTLTATANAGASFDSWGGACAGEASNVCTLTVSDATSVTATFVTDTPDPVGPFTLDVTTTGSGQGTVTSSPAGIDCGTDCTEDFDDGTSVELTAAAGTDSSFTGWGGECAGASGTTCTVTMDAAKSVSAEFVSNTDVTTTVYEIQANSDDAEEFTSDATADFPTGSVQTLSSDIDLNYDTGFSAGTVVGLRYANVDIPQGATITSASLTFTRDGTGAGTVTYTIEGEATDNAATFEYGGTANPATFGITSRPRTTASATWASDTLWGTTATTPDLASVIQEIVDRGGWTSGNALALIISSTDSDASNYRSAESYDGNPAAAAQLTVSYSAPATP